MFCSAHQQAVLNEGEYRTEDGPVSPKYVVLNQELRDEVIFCCAKIFNNNV
jgi:hypothetical protein